MEDKLNFMTDLLTISTKGQITLPVNLRKEYGLNSGDKIFGEITKDGYLIRQPQKGLLDYAGFIKVDNIDPESEKEAVMEAAVARFLGDKEC
jgi:bifunctional DNA-binding transcriptional regulator/antitoxin component of YhaV-PrlF toxin-antitoxin module